MSTCLTAFILPAAAALLPLSANTALIPAPQATAAKSAAPEAAPRPEHLYTRGVLQAGQSAEIAAALAARITHAPHKPGQSFARGDVLIRFDCTRLRAEKAALAEAQTAYKLKAENMRELQAAGAAGALETALADAEARKAGAELNVAEARLKDCTIYAPFAGRVSAKHISAFDTPSAGAPLISIIKSGAPEIKLIAPSTWLSWTQSGTPFTFTVDETGHSHKAKIIRMGAVVDPVSQTIEITGTFKGKPQGALAGMSGRAEFQAPPLNGPQPSAAAKTDP